MKTNVTLQSTDRNLFGINIRQQTKDGWLNLSDLQDAYDKCRIKHGWSKKNVNNIIDKDKRDNVERMFYILEKQGFISLSFNKFIDEVEVNGLVKTLKKYKAYKTTGARHTKTTWANPYVWVLVAMEMNPKLYAEVVSWLADKLIINRIEAGNFYKDLTNAVGKFHDVDYRSLAKAINYIVFNRHETGIRQSATQQQLEDVVDIEKKVAFTVDMGMVKSFEETLELLRKIYLDKYGNSKRIA